MAFSALRIGALRPGSEALWLLCYPTSYKMTTIRYIYWQDGEFWLGHIEDFPDYLTQAHSLEELEENLRELHKDLTSGQIPGVRRLGRLQVA